MRDERKNARPEAATSGRVKRESTRESGNSRNQSTTAADGGQGAVSSLLLEGRSNALHLADLVRLTGWPERDVRKAIQRERQRGSPILSDNKSGYFCRRVKSKRCSSSALCGTGQKKFYVRRMP